MSLASHPFVRAGLGVLLVWSVAVLGVVEGGLGSRYSLHPDAPLDTSRVPEVRLLSGVGGVEGFDEYASIVERPLFSEDRRPQAADGSATEDPASLVISDLSLVVTSIVISGDKRFAIVIDPTTNRSQTVAMGASLEGDQAGWKLTELTPRSAVFEGPGGSRSTLDLRVFDGQGGEPPTPVAQSAPGTHPSAGTLQAKPNEAGEKPADDPVISNDGSPEARAEQIRRRIEERRRQMREEAERANAERGQ